MSDKVQQAVGLALKRLIKQLSKNEQLSKFSSYLQKRKQYDVCERQYIQNQRLRKELGNEYESSDSEQEKQNQFNKMSSIQLKKMIRKNLIDKNFDEQTLQKVKDSQDNQQDIDEFATVKYIDQTVQNNMTTTGFTQLNIIQEAKQIIEEQFERTTNFGLSFFIQQLQRIQKSNFLVAQ